MCLKKTGFYFVHENTSVRWCKFSSKRCSWYLPTNFFIKLEIFVFENKICHWNHLFSRYFVQMAVSLSLFLKNCKPKSWGLLGYSPTASAVTSIAPSGILPKHLIFLRKSPASFKTNHIRPTIFHKMQDGKYKKIQVFRNLFSRSTAVGNNWSSWYIT